MIKGLAEGLAVALELAYEPAEYANVWSEEVECLKAARDRLRSEGVTYENVIDKIIEEAEGA